MKMKGKGVSRDAVLGMVIPFIIALLLILFYLYTLQARTVTIAGDSYLLVGDDSYISMRYAKHFHEGNGLTWNKGQAPIEGFTNFLWVLWISFLMLFDKDPIFFMIGCNAIFHVLSVLLLFTFLRKQVGSGLVISTSLSILMAVWKPIQVQVINGLEGPMLLVIFMASLYLIVGPKPSQISLTIGAWLAGLLPLVRPDGLFFTVVLFVCFVVTKLTPARKTLVNELIKWKYVWFGFFAPFIFLIVFRLFYFGQLLPNTYYLKVAGRPGRLWYGLGYVYRFLMSFYGTPFLIPLLIYFYFKKNQWLKVLGFAMIGNLLYVAYQGGDAWDNWRFMLIFLPLFLIVLASLIKAGYDGDVPIRVFFVSIFLVVMLTGLWPFLQSIRKGTLLPSPQKMIRAPSAENIRLGLLLKEICQKDAVIADFWAGALPYYSELETIDMLGKSDYHIAHRSAIRPGALPGHDKFDFNYVLRKNPDVILSRYDLYFAGSAKVMKKTKSSNDPAGVFLLENPLFKQHFRPVESILSKRWRGIFVRIDSNKIDLSRLEQIELKLTSSGTTR
jgi:hypothetical protein